MKKFLAVLACVLFLAQFSGAQTSTQSGLVGFRRGLATVMFAGLGGAVLGLSTLSFYGEPQDHIGNIWTGLTIGALAGGAYTISQTQSQYSNATALEYTPPRQPRAQQSLTIVQYAWEF